MKKLICVLICVATVFLTGVTVFAGDVNKQSGDISISFFDPGDVNRDHKINKDDAKQLLQYTAGWSMNVNMRKSECDVNHDGKIDGLDALQLLQMIAK